MSFFSSISKGASSIKPAAPHIRKVSTPVQSKDVQRSTDGARTANVIKSATGSANLKAHSTNSFAQPPVKPLPNARSKTRTAAVRSGQKRKSSSPSIRFGSSSEGDSDDAPEDFAHRNARPRVRSPTPDLKRQLRDTTQHDDDGLFTFQHGADLTSAPNVKGYLPAFRDSPDVIEVRLEYPSDSQPERFQLVYHPTDSEAYNPLSDIIDTVIHVCTYYFPAAQSQQLTDTSTGIPYRLRRAYNHQSSSDFLAALAIYNGLVRTARKDGTFSHTIDTQLPARPPLPLVERILSQVYARTVSPRVDLLRRYKNGEDNVYGELLAPFASQIFHDAHLQPHHTFLDLGSGVGNVVLHAALEIGCAAHGVEIMPNPCQLAAAQAAEFGPRCRLWGIAPGSVSLLRGDFLEDERVAKVLRAADVVLVNNQAFNPELNSKLVNQLFLDVKEGARIVSLKSFVPSGWKLTERTMGNPVGLLRVEENEYWSHCVSWTDQGGKYYVAVKDSERLRRFQEDLMKGGRRVRRK